MFITQMEYRINNLKRNVSQKSTINVKFLLTLFQGAFETHHSIEVPTQEYLFTTKGIERSKSDGLHLS
ncbi:CLUMA_CG019907, isoform A [Clunio marinus]|uniref:CLUMA_CG019907, isoform A n=1 Tax=Clunio marinus TaxID=568069 RepID=A0A1J1J753_9DIPT|nr:CLUMA_CG019907, isoform A [Clunio marinus]